MSAFKNVEDGKIVDKLMSDFKRRPEQLSEEQRQQLKDLLVRKDDVEYLSSDEKAALDILSEPKKSFRKKIFKSIEWGALLVLAGLGAERMFFQDKPDADTKAPQADEQVMGEDAVTHMINDDGDLEVEYPLEAVNEITEINRLIEENDKEIALTLKTILEWSEIYVERHDLIPSPAINEEVGRSISFLLRHLDRDDNNKWREIMKTEGLTTDKLRTILVNNCRLALYGDRTLDPNRHENVHFNLVEYMSKGREKSTEYIAADASINTDFSPSKMPKNAVLLILMESVHARLNTVRHKMIEEQHGKLTPKELLQIDAGYAESWEKREISEVMGYVVMMEMANLLENGKLRSIIQNGGKISDQDVVDALFSAEIDTSNLNFREFERMIDMMNIYFAMDLSKLKNISTDFDELKTVINRSR